MKIKIQPSTWRPRQNGPHFAENISKSILSYENWFIFLLNIQISLKPVSKGQINTKPSLVQIMAWHQVGYKLLSEAMMAWFTDSWLCLNELTSMLIDQKKSFGCGRKPVVLRLILSCLRVIALVNGPKLSSGHVLSEQSNFLCAFNDLSIWKQSEQLIIGNFCIHILFRLLIRTLPSVALAHAGEKSG